ncbi:MAG: GatB/YqeY domain-containing protein [Firmicutes bacterium]|nr:GatB/YqeY domain-containing protein [Bacillota bacterium]
MNIDTINNDLKEAMKSGNKFDLNVLRMLKSALQNESISKKHELDESEVIAVIKKQVKVRKDSIEEYEKYGRTDLVENLQKEVTVLSKYLPEELSESEIDKKIDEVFAKLNPTSMKDMGGIMKELQCIASVADMSVVSSKVKDKINGLN